MLTLTEAEEVGRDAGYEAASRRQTVEDAMQYEPWASQLTTDWLRDRYRQGVLAGMASWGTNIYRLS